jgi:DNA-binding transcriptional MerR regulator/methylmalonyl-CoA mutase cobalamin-binding subunit
MAEPQESAESGGYSIRIASRLSGLSADTLRMWERRYGFPRPARNASRARVYSRQDVERLTLIARALKSGYRAGEVVSKDLPSLRDLLSDAVVVERIDAPQSSSVSSLIACLRRDDAEGLRAELRQAVATHGPRQFVSEIASPLISAVGEEWAQRRLDIRHEHLLTEALTTQLRLLLSAYEGSTRRPLVLLSTLPGEKHGLGLEMAALFVALEGATPRLLGVDTPVDQIAEAAHALRVDVVALSIAEGADPNTQLAHLGLLLQKLPPRIDLWVGGAGVAGFKPSDKRLHFTRTWDDLAGALARWSA